MSNVLAIDHALIAMPKGGEADTRRFYVDLLGFDEIEKPASLLARGGCWFASGAAQIHLGAEADFRPAKKAHVAFRVADLAKMQARVTNAGLPVRSDDAEIPGIARFFTEDFFGNRVEIVGGPGAR
jgi:catechol 2,3-dioxygenase-like lactoylglutathione lyase family enzyme